MIAEIWRGATASRDAQDYVQYLRETGVKAYTQTPGNHGVRISWRKDGNLAEFLTVSLWESREAIARFAGA